jgi:hypothetical protein
MARPTLGPDLVDRLPGSDFARDRMRTILEVLAGTLSVQDAAAHLQVSPQYFDRIREEALAAGVAAMEPKPIGRPPAAIPAATALITADAGAEDAAAGNVGDAGAAGWPKGLDETTQLKIALRAAQLREEIALVFGPRFQKRQKKRKPKR